MSFFAPAAAAFALLAALIVVQYFLKLRRPALPVASTFLWRRAMVDSRANTPWQRLRADPLLLLQLLGLAALVFALMRPYVLRAGTVSENLVIVLDASLTSQGTDVAPSRFAAEVARARALVDGLPPDRTVSLVRMDSHPRVLLASGTDHGAFDDILAHQTAGFDQPDVTAAASIAESLAGAGQSLGAHPRIVVLHSAATRWPATTSGAAVTDEAFGTAGAPNLGIAAFAAARQSDGTVSAVVRVHNTGAVSRASDVHVLADGRLWDVQSVSVGAGGDAVITSSGLPGNSRVLEARIMAGDSLAADNTAWTVLDSTATPRVLLVSTGNLFLERALAAAGSLNLSEVTPQAYTAAQALDADLVIFDRFLPTVLPAANLLLIDPPGSALGIVVGKARTFGTPSLDDDPAGLLRYLTVADIHVYGRAPALTAPPWARVALRDQGGPLVLEGTPGGGVPRAAVLGFDLLQTDLPLNLNFPLLVANLLGWLAPPSGIDQHTLAPGAIAHIALPAGTTQATMRTPDGRRISLTQPGQTAAGTIAGTFADTGLPGVYTLSARVNNHPFQVDFSVNPQVSLATGAAPAAPARATPTARARAGTVPMELTGGIAVLVLIVLAGEWYVAMRRR